MLRTIQYYTPFPSTIKAWFYGDEEAASNLIENDVLSYSSINITEQDMETKFISSDSVNENLSVTNENRILTTILMPKEDDEKNIDNKNKKTVNFATFLESSLSNSDSESKELGSNKNSSNIENDPVLQSPKDLNIQNKQDKERQSKLTKDILASLLPKNITQKKKVRNRSRSIDSINIKIDYLGINSEVQYLSKSYPRVIYSKSDSDCNENCSIENSFFENRTNICKSIEYTFDEKKFQKSDIDVSVSSIELAHECREDDISTAYSTSQDSTMQRLKKDSKLLYGQQVHDAFLQNESFCCQCVIL